MTLSDQSKNIINLSRKSETSFTLIYIYPKDMTPGCTQQGQDFSELFETYLELDVEVIGASKDNEASHKRFKAEYLFKHNLISDVDLSLINELGAYGEKNNYGKITKGVIRSTFLLDKDLNVIKSWKNVRAKGHAEKILRELPVILKTSEYN